MQDVQNAVAAQQTVEDSVVTLLNQVAQQVRDAKTVNDPAALDKLAADIQANTDKLSEAVKANTPAA